MKKLLLFGLLTLGLSGLTSCIEPPLHLPDEGADIDLSFTNVRLDIDLLWDYDSIYNWKDEWIYGWDETDTRLFGDWDIQEPSTFNIRRYYTGKDSLAEHTRVNEHQVDGYSLLTHYYVGYYDILTWNEVTTLDGVQSLHFDEETTLEHVTAYTNQSTRRAHYAPSSHATYYQPEFLFSGYYENLYISDKKEDYDYYDEETNTYFKVVKTILEPRTYIYLFQLILHHNYGRVSGVDGSANLSGMARTCNLNTGITGEEEIAVNYDVRLKQHIDKTGEDVDVVGGRLFTFGICGLNPSRATRAVVSDTNTKSCYIDLDMSFASGSDSTFVFDVTDQVLERYKGGILTVELDMDTVPIPSKGNSGFDAKVEDYEEESHEFDMGG